MRIAITTPTGHVGRQVVGELLKGGEHELVLLARKPEAVAAEKARGAMVMQGDLADAVFVRRATRRVQALLWVTPPQPDAADLRDVQNRLGLNAAGAIRANDIRRVVMLSSLGAQHAKGVGPVSGLHDVERLLRGAAVNLTLLRPTFFMENLLPSAESIAHEQRIYLPLPGALRLPLIATRDVAAAAVKALGDTLSLGVKIVPLLGPRDYAFDEVAEIVSRALGQTVKWVETSPEQTRQALLSRGVSANVADHVLEMYAAIVSGHLTHDEPRTPESSTPTTLEAFVETVLAPAVYAAAKA
jgi:uncharacterized protein YbjT (DUF2867 family)